MNDRKRAVFLLGPEAETGPVAEALAAQEYEVRCFSLAEDFAQELLRAAPGGAVLWDDADVGVGAVYELLRHHLPSRDCRIVMVRRGPAEGLGAAGGPSSVVGWPVAPEELLRALGASFEDGGEAGRGIPRVLVVDDDASIVLLGSHIVSSMGMIPLVAFDGPEAVEKAVRFRPDLVLLDINMPRMDGFDVIRALKAESTTALIPIIVFSARKDEEDKVRALGLGADDYVTKPFSITELGARMDRLIKRTRLGMSASSTTGLPGSLSLEQVLLQRIRDALPLAVLYIDIDHFKSFNDRYGFARGDSVIRQTADVIFGGVHAHGNPDDFVGHIGGDDFVVVTTPPRAMAVADAIIERFDRIVPYYYDREDRERGSLVTEDRKGRSAAFPLMSLSIAMVTSENRVFGHPGEVADVAAQLKRLAKSRPGSVWVKDQRGNHENAS